MTKATGHASDVSDDALIGVPEIGETVCVPDFSSHRYAFHEEVLNRCRVPNKIRKEVLLTLLLLRKGQNQLSQVDFWEKNSLDDIQLPSTQPRSDEESDSSSSFDVHVFNQMPSQRLINERHPWRGIRDVKSGDSKEPKCQVQVEWWEMDPLGNGHWITWQCAGSWMKGPKEVEELAKFLAEHHNEKKSEKIVGCPDDWKKLKPHYDVHRELSCQSTKKNAGKQSSTKSSSRLKRKNTKQNNRYLKKRPKRSIGN